MIINVKLLLRSDSNLYCPRVFEIIQKTQTILIILHAIHWKQSEKQTPITLLLLRLQQKCLKQRTFLPIFVVTQLPHTPLSDRFIANISP